MPIHNNFNPVKRADLLLTRGILPKQSNEETVSGGQTPLGQGVTTVEQYKTIISSKITSLATDMQALNKNLHGMTVPVMPDKDELVEISEDGTLDDEAYQDALDEYNEQMADYNQRANELRNKIAQLAVELQNLNKIFMQLKQVEGDTISQDLKDQVADAVANKEEIAAADDITTDNMEVQVYIDKFKAQRAELVLPVEGINSEIEKLGATPEPVFANFVNSDGTIDVDGYKAAINEYNQAQQKIIELVEQLKEIKRQTDELDALITELGSAKTVQDFRDKLMEHHKLSIAQTQDIEEISPELINEQIESTQQEINGLAIEKAGYVGALINLNGQVSSLIDDFTNAFNNAPKLDEGFVQNGIPNIQAYNDAVEKYNTEQENRLKAIEEKLKLIIDYETKCKEIDDKISSLNEKLVQLEEKAAQLKADMDTLQALEGKEFSSKEEIQAAVDGLGVQILEQGKDGNVTSYNVGNDTLGWVAVTVVEETKEEAKTEEEVPETTAQTFETPTERHAFITDTLNDLKEYFEQYYKGQGGTDNFESVWANVLGTVHNELGEKESLTQADVINAAKSALDSGIAKARENATPKIDINGELDTTTQTFDNPGQTHAFIQDTLNDAKESFRQDYEGETGMDNFESVWANVLGTVHNELGEKESLTQADVINAAKSALDSGIAKARENATPKIDINGELDTTTQTFDNPGQTHPFIDKTLLAAKDSFRQYYKEQTGKDDFGSVWNTVIQTIHKELGEKESLTQADVINAAKAALEAEIEKIKEASIDVNGDLDTTAQTFDNPGQTHPFIDKTLLAAKDSFRQYYEEQTGKDDFGSVWNTVIQTIHKELGEKESLTQADVINAARAELDKLITDDKNQNIEKIKGYVTNIINSIKGGDYQALTGLKIFENDGVEFSVTRNRGKYVINIVYADGNINATINIDETDEVTEFLTSNGLLSAGTRAATVRGGGVTGDDDEGDGEDGGNDKTYTDSQGRTVVDHYGEDHRLQSTTITDQNGNVTVLTYEWSNNGYRQIQTDEKGNRYITVYEINGEEYVRTGLIVEYKDGKTYTYDWPENGQQVLVSTTETNPSGDTSDNKSGEDKLPYEVWILDKDFNSEGEAAEAYIAYIMGADSPTPPADNKDDNHVPTFEEWYSANPQIPPSDAMTEYNNYLQVLHSGKNNQDPPADNKDDNHVPTFEEWYSANPQIPPSDAMTEYNNYLQVLHSGKNNQDKPGDNKLSFDEWMKGKHFTNDAEALLAYWLYQSSPDEPSSDSEIKNKPVSAHVGEDKDGNTVFTLEFEDGTVIVETYPKDGGDKKVVVYHDTKPVDYNEKGFDSMEDYLRAVSLGLADKPDEFYGKPGSPKNEGNNNNEKTYYEQTGFFTEDDYRDAKARGLNPEQFYTQYPDRIPDWKRAGFNSLEDYYKKLGFANEDDYYEAKSLGIEDSDILYGLKLMGYLDDVTDIIQPIKDKNGNVIGMAFLNPDKSPKMVVIKQAETLIVSHPGGEQKFIQRTETGINMLCHYDKNGNVIVDKAVDANGNDVTKQTQQEMNKINYRKDIAEKLKNGDYGTGANFNRSEFLNDMVKAGYEIVRFDNLTTQQIYNILTINAGKSFEAILEILYKVNEKGGYYSGLNDNYGKTGGQSFGLGDQGFNDVFGNTSYSDGYHLDFWGNWVSNASGGSNNWGHGGGGGGGIAHY